METLQCLCKSFSSSRCWMRPVSNNLWTVALLEKTGDFDLINYLMFFKLIFDFPDSIIAFVHNENGESQKVVLSREDTEALKIHLEPQNSVPMEGVEQVPDESLLEMVHEPQQEEQDILPMLMGEPETVPEAPEVIQEPAMEEEPETLALDELPKVDKPQAEPESVPESAGQSTSNDVLSNNIQVLTF